MAAVLFCIVSPQTFVLDYMGKNLLFSSYKKKKKKKNLRKIWPREMNISYLSMKDFHTERLETGKKSEVRGDKMVSMSSSP